MSVVIEVRWAACLVLTVTDDQDVKDPEDYTLCLKRQASITIPVDHGALKLFCCICLERQLSSRFVHSTITTHDGLVIHFAMMDAPSCVSTNGDVKAPFPAVLHASSLYLNTVTWSYSSYGRHLSTFEHRSREKTNLGSSAPGCTIGSLDAFL